MSKAYLHLMSISTLKALALALAFAVNFLLVRHIGTNDFGRYSEFYATVMIASIVGRLGLETITVRELARKPALYSDHSLMRTVYSAVINGTLVTGVVVFLTSGLLGKYSNLLAVLGVAAAVGFSVKIISSQILRGRKFASYSTVFDGVAVPTVMIAGLAILGFVTTGTEAAAFFTAAVALAAILASVIAYRFAIRPFRTEGETARFSSLWGSVKQLWPITILSTATQRWIPVIIMGKFSTHHDIAVYVIAFQLANFVIFFLMSTNVFLAPRYAALADPAKRPELRALIRKFYRFNTAVALLIAAPMIVFAEWIMKTYSPEFAGTGLILILLVAGQLVSVLGGNFGLLLSMTYNDKAHGRNAYFGFGGFIVLALILAPPFGALGVSVAFMISSLFLSINGNLLLQKVAGVRATILF